jgi:uncharacterized protein
VRLRLFLLSACALAVPAFAVTALPAAASSCAGLPKHTAIPVVDVANVVRPPQVGYLAADLVRYHVTGHQAIVVATVPNLGGDDVASYATRLFDCWGIGDADSDNGVLILVAMREHRVRIELGAGLTGDLTEADLDAAIRTMTGPLRSGDVGGALRAGAVAVADKLGEPLPDTEHDPTGAGTGGAGQSDDVTPSDVTDATSGDGPSGSAPYVDAPGFGPFADSGNGSGFGAFAFIPVFLVLGLLVTVLRAVTRGGVGPSSGGAWRGGFPRYGGAWGGGSLLHGGYWQDSGGSRAGSFGSFGGGSDSDSGSGSSGSSFGGGSSSGGSSGGSSSGSSGGSFGGGSSGGGGASGSW